MASSGAIYDLSGIRDLADRFARSVDLTSFSLDVQAIVKLHVALIQRSVRMRTRGSDEARFLVDLQESISRTNQLLVLFSDQLLDAVQLTVEKRDALLFDLAHIEKKARYQMKNYRLGKVSVDGRPPHTLIKIMIEQLAECCELPWIIKGDRVLLTEHFKTLLREVYRILPITGGKDWPQTEALFLDKAQRVARQIARKSEGNVPRTRTSKLAIG